MISLFLFVSVVTNVILAAMLCQSRLHEEAYRNKIIKLSCATDDIVDEFTNLVLERDRKNDENKISVEDRLFEKYDAFNDMIKSGTLNVTEDELRQFMLKAKIKKLIVD